MASLTPAFWRAMPEYRWIGFLLENLAFSRKNCSQNATANESRHTDSPVTNTTSQLEKA
jgi:hypothetical protein